MIVFFSTQIHVEFLGSYFQLLPIIIIILPTTTETITHLIARVNFFYVFGDLVRYNIEHG